MPISYAVEQYSEEWDRIKSGVPSSSGFSNVITPLGKESKSLHKYAHGLIAERLLKRRVDSFMSPWMERGVMLESEAVTAYEIRNDIECEKIGFVTTDDRTIGCSPDRLVGQEGLLEIKVPKPDTMVGYLLENAELREYYPQLQGQLLVTGRKWVDIMAYHPEMPFAVMRMKRDEPYIDAMRLLLDKLVTYINEKMAFIQTLQGELNNG